jgi:hypothetical protein
VQEIKDAQKGNIHQHIKPSMLNNRVSPKGMHYSIVTAFNDKQDYTRSNKEVPPKDAQLLEGPNHKYEYTT